MLTCAALTVSWFHLDWTIHLQQMNVLLIRRYIHWRITQKFVKSRLVKQHPNMGELRASQTYHSVEIDIHTKYTARSWPDKLGTRARTCTQGRSH